MNNNVVKEILYTLIAIAVGILVVRFVIWLLPIILLIMVSVHIYKSIIKKRRPVQKTKKKSKNVKIIDMVEEDN